VTSNLTNSLKTWTLLAALGGLLIAVGGLLGGQTGLVIALVFAVAMNVFVYWKSDSLALKANGARELRPDELPAPGDRRRPTSAGPADAEAVPRRLPWPNASRPAATRLRRRRGDERDPEPDGRASCAASRPRAPM
jgi:Zn-dependent protease with chaperone function